MCWRPGVSRLHTDLRGEVVPHQRSSVETPAAERIKMALQQVTPMSLLQSFCGGHNSSVSGSCSATQSMCPGLSQTASTKTYGSLGMLKKRFYSAADVKDDFSTGYCSFPASLVRVVPQGSASAPSSSRLSAEFLRPLGRSCFLLRFVF